MRDCILTNTIMLFYRKNYNINARRINLKNRFAFSATHWLLISFLILIFVGSILLSLPISSADGESVPYIDALFTATTASCVTGLVTVTTVSTWSNFGHVIILILIQIGGLGVITAIAAFAAFLNKKVGISKGVLLQDTLNLNTASELTAFIQRVVRGVFVVELIGAILYSFVFVPEFGLRGIWISVFTSISAFCNAGIDIIAENSLCNYATNPLITITTSALVIVGGAGYIVWLDIIRVLRDKNSKKRKFQFLTLHSKIAIVSTIILLLSGAVLIFMFEFNNHNTIGDMSLLNKVQVSFFQSMTTRTAGFASIPQENITNPAALVCILLMFVGGSPVGTAGGVKTVTFIVVFIAAISTIRGKSDVVLFNRKIPKQIVSKSIAIIVMSFSITFISTLLLSICTNANFVDILYEATSACATVGLTRNLTPSLSLIGKIIIIFTMYLGRVGPISLALAFNIKKENTNIIKEPEEEISVG